MPRHFEENLGPLSTARAMGIEPGLAKMLDKTPELELKKMIRKTTASYERALLKLRKARRKVAECEKAVKAARREMRSWLDCISTPATPPPAPAKKRRGEREPF